LDDLDRMSRTESPEFGAVPRAAVRAEGSDVAGGHARVRDELLPTGRWVDIHAHPGRCFLRGVSEEDAIRAVLGPDDTERAVEALQASLDQLS
jgi:hypothetical protein